jgi:hypothetical protein
MKGYEHTRDGWACLVCQRRCYCNRCENEKRTVMAVAIKEGPRKGILKRGSKKREVSKEESDGEDEEETRTRLG